MRKRGVPRALLVIVVLGGCVTAGRSPSGLGAVPAPVEPAPPGVPETASFTVTYATNDPGRKVLLSARGTFDHRRHRYAVELDGSLAAGRPVARRTVAVDGVVYLDFPDLARRLGVTTPWISAQLDPDNPFDPREFDPDRFLDSSSSSGAEVERDARGLVRRITMRFDAPGEGGGVVLTVTYDDLDAPVTIEPPPAEQVTDKSDVLSRRPGTRTGG